MRATERVSFIPLGRPFLYELAAGLLARTQGQPEHLADILLLLPTRRAVREITDIFLDLTDGQPLLLPRLQAIADIDVAELEISLTAWCGAAMPAFPPAITMIERDTLLARLIQARGDAGSLEGALSLAQALGRFMDEVENENLDLANLDRVAPAEYATHWQLTLNFLALIRDVWPAILAERQQMNPSQRRNALLRAITQFWTAHPPANTIIAAGLTGSLPAVAELLDVIRTLRQGEIILPGLDPALDHATLDIQHPQYELYTLLRRFALSADLLPAWADLCPRDQTIDLTIRNQALHHVMAPTTATATWAALSHRNDAALLKNALADLTVLEADTTMAEAMAIALLIRQNLADPTARIAVVTPNRHLAAHIMHACRRFDIQVNDSAGATGGETSTGRLLRLLLHAAHDLHPIDILALLRHPVLQTAPADLMSIDQALRGPRPSPHTDRFADLLQHRLARTPTAWTTLQHLLAGLAPLQESAPQSATAWLRQHITIAESLAARSDANDSPLWQDEAGETLARAMGEWLSAKIDDAPLTLKEYAAWFDHALSNVRINTRHGDHPRVALLGVYEARLTGADHVILAGMNEGVWPAEPGIDPWLSRSMRHNFGLPVAEIEIGRMAHDVLCLLLNPRVTLTRSRTDGGSGTVPSRWLERLDAVFLGLGGDPRDLRADEILNWARDLDAWSGPIAPIGRPCPRPPVLTRPRTLSATQIRTLMTDPYAVYVGTILNLRPTDPLDAPFDARWGGIILHRVLEQFVRAHGPLWPVDGAEHLDTILQQTLTKMWPDARAHAPLLPRLRRALMAFADLTLKNTQPGTTLLGLETPWSLALQVQDVPHHLTARLDRLERAPNGHVTIIDYKTGSKLPSLKDIAHGIDPQLMVESLVVAQGENPRDHLGPQIIDHAALWHIHPRGGSVLRWGSDENDKDAQPLAPLLQTAATALIELLAAYQDPDTGYPSLPDPTRLGGRDSYVHHLARVDEWHLGEGESEGEAA